MGAVGEETALGRPADFGASRPPALRRPMLFDQARDPQDTIKPNLFIIGAMKSGTTFLWSLLASHPSIFLCRPKEPSYFIDPGQLRELQPWLWRQGYWRSEEAYLKLFRSARDAAIVGEASVYYTHLPHASGVAERISRFNPEARLIYIMRDPIERTISHYWHRVRHNREYRSISQAIKNDPQYRDVSYYKMQIAPYLTAFGRDQIKLLTFEELIGNTVQTVRGIFRWLSVDGSFDLPLIPPANVTPETIDQFPAWWESVSRLKKHNDLVNGAIDHIPVSIRRGTRQMISRRINRPGVDIDEVVQYLRPLQQKQTQELTHLIGKDFPEWRTLNR